MPTSLMVCKPPRQVFSFNVAFEFGNDSYAAHKAKTPMSTFPVLLGGDDERSFERAETGRLLTTLSFFESSDDENPLQCKVCFPLPRTYLNENANYLLCMNNERV